MSDIRTVQVYEDGSVDLLPVDRKTMMYPQVSRVSEDGSVDLLPVDSSTDAELTACRYCSNEIRDPTTAVYLVSYNKWYCSEYCAGMDVYDREIGDAT